MTDLIISQNLLTKYLLCFKSNLIIFNADIDLRIKLEKHLIRGGLDLRGSNFH